MEQKVAKGICASVGDNDELGWISHRIEAFQLATTASGITDPLKNEANSSPQWKTRPSPSSPFVDAVAEVRSHVEKDSLANSVTEVCE